MALVDSALNAALGLGSPDAPAKPRSSLPYVSKQVAATIGGVHTEFVLTKYDDLVFLIVSQLDKLGSIVRVHPQCCFSDARQVRIERTAGEHSASMNYSVDVLLGKRDEPVTNIYSRQVAELVSASTALPVVLALALRDKAANQDTLRGILTVLHHNRVW